MNILVTFALLLFGFVQIAFGQTSNQSVKFNKQEVTLGKVKIVVEVATTKEQHEYGLMYRTKLKTNTGMLFVFENAKPLSFWMKNTFIDLDIGYFNVDGVLFEIQQMKAVASEAEQNIKSYPSSKPARYALEMEKGWFKKNSIKIGDRLIYRGSIRP